MGKSHLIVKLVKLYQKCLSPYLPNRCRFYPTCSDYTIQSIAKFGVLKGISLAFRRILKCHPYHPGGYDPI